MENLDPLPSLYHNGALDPDAWAPGMNNRASVGGTIPEAGDLVGWRYGAWRVAESNIISDVDMKDEDRDLLDKYISGLREEHRPRAFMQNRPRHIVLRHESGPRILKPGERGQRLHDGSRTIHFTVAPLRHGRPFHVLREPHQTCSCHGHIWPCQEIDQTVLTAHQSRKMDKLMATAQPGVCANCLEPISTRQKTLTFPEESRYVPGAPGPTFHAGRADCWRAAEEYEREGRLTDNPDVARLASCPGIRFIHEQHGLRAEQRVECTAGPFCTGHHGPAGYRQDAPCWHRVQIAGNDGAYARPSIDCGYRGGHGECLGADLSSGGSSLSPTAADLLWENSRRSRQR